LLVRHSALYALGRGGPGLINFMALALYTRLLTPVQYGQYALVLAGLGLVQVIGFQWLSLCLARFLSANHDAPERFLSEIKYLFVFPALVFSAVGLLIVILWPDPVWQRLLALAVPLLVAQSWYQLNLFHAAAALNPGLYGRINLTRSAVSLALGSLLAWLGLGAYSPLWGLLLGAGMSTLVIGRSVWRDIRPVRPDPEKIKLLLVFGMPLAANFALAWVVSSSDRFLLGWLLGVDSAGQYAVGYDLAQQSIGTLLMIINLASYPLVVHALEQNGAEVARGQLQKNGVAIFTLAFSAAAGVAVLAPLLGRLLLGVEYGDSAVQLLPWVALAAALSGLKSYYFDTAFHLGHSTIKLVWISIGAALINVIFNLMWIPHFGILGAAYATVLTYCAAMIGSAWLGQRYFDMPAIMPLVVPALVVSASTAFAAWLAMQYGGWGGLAFGLLAGVSAAMLSAISINLVGIRQGIQRRLQKRRMDSSL